MNACEVSFRPAGFARRLLAFAFDFLLIAAYILVLIGIGASTNHLTSELLGSPWRTDLIAFLVLVLPVILYFAVQEGSHRQATWGKRKVGIKVLNAQGGKLNGRQALIRSVIKFFPWQLAHTCVIQIQFGQTSSWLIVVAVLAQGLVGVYVLSILVSKEHRAPYDWLSGAYVIDHDLVSAEHHQRWPRVFNR